MSISSCGNKRTSIYTFSVNGGEAITVTDSEYRFTGTYNSEYSISVVAFSESNPDSTAANVTVKTEADPYIYLKPNSNWTQANARFAIYTWTPNVNNSEKWVDMTAVGDGTYKALKSDLQNSIIFCRMNPATTDNNWNDGVKWDKTRDLTIPTDGKNLYTIKDGAWTEEVNNSGSWGSWSVK